MADEATPLPETAPPGKDPIASIAGQLRHAGTGTLARLRRFHPQADGAQVAMFDLERVLQAADIRAVPGPERDRWALLLHCLALAHGRHEKRIDAEPGAVMSRLRFSEARVRQLVEADEAVLADLLPRIARRFAAAGATVNWWPLADLLLHTGSEDNDQLQRADAARQRLIRYYLQAQARAGSDAQADAATDA
jgi:hypothetical protein